MGRNRNSQDQVEKSDPDLKADQENTPDIEGTDLLAQLESEEDIQLEKPENAKLKNLAVYLKNHPRHEKVYLNEHGEHHFSPIEGFVEFESQEIINNI